MPDEPTTCPIPLAEFGPSTGDPNAAVGLPPAAYTSDEFFEFERRAVFEREWHCVGRVEQIPEPGDYLATTMLGNEPIIVSRTKDDEIKVMSAVCQHRGMCVTSPAERPAGAWFEPLPEHRGNTRTFRCPYHLWTYDLDGRLLGAPSMERRVHFDKADHGLPQLKVELWQGFIFAHLDADARPLSDGTKKLDEVLENYHLDEWVTRPVEPHVMTSVPFNWKIMIENFMESYHNYGLHRRLLDLEGYGEGVAADSGFHPAYEDGDSVIFGVGTSAVPDAAVNPTQKGFFPPLDTLTDTERHQFIFGSVPPTLLIGIFSDSGFWFTVEPETSGTHRLQMGYFFPKATTESTLFPAKLDLYDTSIQLFNNQDLPANHSVQYGMESRFAPRGPLSHMDLFLPKFNQWLLDRYTSDSTAP